MVGVDWSWERRHEIGHFGGLMLADINLPTVVLPMRKGADIVPCLYIHEVSAKLVKSQSSAGIRDPKAGGGAETRPEL
jgi:hypothetical protein